MLKRVQTQTTLATCPDCGRGIRLKGEISVGRKATCPNCDTQLAVIETAPVKLDWVWEEWDVDEDDW